MTLVDDDVAEVIGRVERSQEVPGPIFGIDIECLVRRNVDARIPCIVAPILTTVNLSRVRPEHVLECPQPLSTQLVPVADEKSALQLACVRDALHEVDRDEGLTGTGGQGEQRSFFAARKLF